MLITMHDVNFGECILYEENDRKLLVDCGAKFGNKGKDAYNSIKTKIGSNIDLLITHFDEDHYNGINEIPNGTLFDNIYLPFYLYKGKTIVPVFHYALKLWAYSVVIGRQKKISTLHKFFLKIPKILSNSGVIKCVKEGDTINLSRLKLNVLWPPIESPFESEYRPNIDSVFEAHDEFNKWRDTADNYTDSVERFYRDICLDDINDLEGTINELNQSYETMIGSAPTIELSEDELNNYNAINSSMIRNMNECSVVFDCNDTLVAFGDVSARIISWLRSDDTVKASYEVVKVQHHGTKSYWCDDIPSASYYLISNSGIKRQDWKIDERYGKKASKTCTILCTNDTVARCEYHNSKKKPCTKKCNLIKYNNEIKLKT